MDTKPKKRHPSLQPLSRHHHHALVVAQMLIKQQEDHSRSFETSCVIFGNTEAENIFAKKRNTCCRNLRNINRLISPRSVSSGGKHIRIREFGQLR